MTTALAGTVPLLRATVRFDGRRFAPWIAIVTALSASSVLVYPWIFPTVQDRDGLATAISANPAIGLIFGPARNLITVDGFNAWRSLALGGFIVALGAIFAVTRATRGQEDSGQAELLASGVLGRSSRLLSGVGLALIGSLVAGVVAGLVTVLCGGGWEASLLLGATFTATGWMFAAIAAVAAQVSPDVHTANSLAVGALGVLFIARGFAYSVEAPGWALWANPMSWISEAKPASGNSWWPLALPVLFTLVVLAVAFALQARRDFGQGALAPRLGPARGKVRGPWGLALRLNRGTVITWGIVFVVLGAVFGNFAGSISDLLGSDSAVSAILASGATTHAALVSAFLVTILSIIGIIAAVPGVQVMLRVRSEELADRLEPIIAGDVRRPRYYGANVILAFVAPAGCVVIAGAILAAIVAGAGIGVDYGTVLLQALATIPAVWTVIAIAVAVIGARPAVTMAAWLGVLLAFVLTLLGPTFKLSDWMLAFSPFWHVPNVSMDAHAWGLVWVSVVTVLFVGVGFAGFRRRDVGV